MIDRRLIGGYVLISLPALFATAFAILACHRLKPLYDEREKVRVTAAYREIAEGLRDDPSRGTIGSDEGVRGRSRSMKPGRWGYVEDEKGALVWYRLFERLQVERVPKAESLSLSAILMPTLNVALFLFWLVTVAGCVLFRKSVKDRDDFLAATAHDLKTPLVALRRLVAAGDGRSLAEASLAVERLMLLVSNLTDFLRLGGKIARAQIEPVDLRVAYDEAARLFEGEYRWLRGKDLVLSGPETCLVSADSTLLHRVIWNLLSNEFKYAAPVGDVSVTIEDGESDVRLVFRDEGPGLSVVDRYRVFKRYFRAKRVLESGKGGFGLGLCTAREFARMMGGDLTAKANSPKGTAFILTLRRW